ncbi:unnamed protein product [Musa acuminata var. zebrina]
MVMMAAGTAASPRLTRHPHPPLILEVGGENSDGDHELETEVQRASEPSGRHLRDYGQSNVLSYVNQNNTVKSS